MRFLGLLTVVLASSFCTGAGASSLEVLMYRNLAHEESNRLFLANVELGQAHSNVARAEYLHGKNVQLRVKNVVSEFEYFDSMMKVMETKFAEKRAVFHVIECETREKIWKLHLESLENGKESRKAVAGLYMQIANARKKVFDSLTEALVPYIELLTEEFNRSAKLKNGGNITESDFKKIEILKDDFVGLQALASKELEKAKAQVITTEVDLSEATAAEEPLQD